MLIWSRHNRPGPAVAQSPHNNPPRPRLSLSSPPPPPPLASRPAKSRVPRSAAPRSTPPSVSLRPAGRFRPPGRGGGGKTGRAGEAPLAGRRGRLPRRSLIKSSQRRRRLSDFLPRGRSGALAEAHARERDSLPSLGGRNAASVRKSGATRDARGLGATPPPFFRGGCGAGCAPAGARPSSGTALGWLCGPRVRPPESGGCRALARGGIGPWSRRPLRPQALPAGEVDSVIHAAVLVSESLTWGLIP